MTTIQAYICVEDSCDGWQDLGTFTSVAEALAEAKDFAREGHNFQDGDSGFTQAYTVEVAEYDIDELNVEVVADTGDDEDGYEDGGVPNADLEDWEAITVRRFNGEVYVYSPFEEAILDGETLAE